MAMEWLTVTNKKSKSDIYIYGEVSNEKMWDEDVTPFEIKEELKKLNKTTKVDMHINSPGGGVFAGFTIYNLISELKQRVTAHVEGLAASIASVIAMAADVVRIPETALIMIHNPSGMAMGEADEMRKTADLLDKVKTIITGVYAKKTGLSEGKIAKMMDDETWLTGQEAFSLSFADSLSDNGDSVVNITNQVNGSVIFNGLAVDISKFKAFPDIKKVKQVNVGIEQLKNRYNTLKNHIK